MLGRFGPDANTAIPDLTAALDDPNETVRKAAAQALNNVQQE